MRIANQHAWPLTFELYLPQEWRANEKADHSPHYGLDALSRETADRLGTQARQVRTVSFALTAVVADADHRSKAPFRREFERLGLRYGVAIQSSLVMGPQARGGQQLYVC